MCFGSNDTQAAAPATPTETLSQAAPVKKTVDNSTPAVTDNSGVVLTGDTKTSTVSTPTTSSNALTIGTKKYRNSVGMGASGASSTTTPSGIALAL